MTRKLTTIGGPPCRNPTEAFVLVVFSIALLLMCTVDAALERPPTIKFGMTHNMEDQFLVFDGTQMYAGAQAAMKEINEAGVIDGITLEMEHVPPGPLLSAVVTPTMVNFTNDPQYFGSILSDWGTSSYLADVIKTEHNSTYPMIAARQLMDSAFRNDSRFDLSLRQPPSTEFLMMLHHALNMDDIRCTSFAVLTQSFFETGVVVPTLSRLGFSSVSIDLRVNAFALPNTTQVLDAWFAGNNTGYFTPSCGLFFCLGDAARAIIEAMYTDPRFDMPRMAFYGASLTSEGQWNSTLHGTAPYTRFHFVTNFPDPNSAINPLAINFRSSLANYLATVNMSSVPAAMKQIPFASIPTFPALEGYLAVKWIANVLAAMPSINRTLFLDAVYNRKMFWVNDVTIGPMTDRCLVDSTTDLTCFCNAGMAMLQIVQVSNLTGFPIPDEGDDSVTTLSYPLNQCFLQPDELRSPIAFELWYPQVTNAAGQQAFVNVQRIMSTLSIQYNDALSTPRVMFSATLMNELVPFHANESNAAYEKRVYMRHRPTIAFGGLWTEVTEPVINVITLPTTLYEDAPLTAATQYSRYSWMLKPTLADLVHGVVLYLEALFSDGGERQGRTPLVFVVSDTAQGLSVAVRSVNTVQWPVSGGGGLLNASSYHVMRAQMSAAMDVAAGGQDVVLVVCSLTSAAIINAVQAAAELSQQYEGTSAAQNVWDHFILAIPTDQNYVYNAKFAMLNTSAVPHFPISR